MLGELFLNGVLVALSIAITAGPGSHAALFKEIESLRS